MMGYKHYTQKELNLSNHGHGAGQDHRSFNKNGLVIAGDELDHESDRGSGWAFTKSNGAETITAAQPQALIGQGRT